MDATIYQIIFGELGDINCSLMDAFQDTFLENTSLSLLNIDGKVEVFLPSFLFFSAKHFLDKKNERLFFPPPGFYCNATTDEIGTCWPRSSAGRIVERPCPEYINGVKYNTTSKNWNSNKSFNVGGGQVPKHTRFQIKKILIYDFCQRDVLTAVKRITNLLISPPLLVIFFGGLHTDENKTCGISAIIRLRLLSPEQLEHTELFTGSNITLMLLIFFTVKAFWVHFQIWHFSVEFACSLQLLLFPPTFPKTLILDTVGRSA